MFGGDGGRAAPLVILTGSECVLFAGTGAGDGVRGEPTAPPETLAQLPQKQPGSSLTATGKDLLFLTIRSNA